jgi:hypothetical protein
MDSQPRPSPTDAERARLAEGLRAALGELGEVFSGLVRTAESKSSLRCPYMNVKRECTARFECINQLWGKKGRRATCSGQHRINFACCEEERPPKP